MKDYLYYLYIQIEELLHTFPFLFATNGELAIISMIASFLLGIFFFIPYQYKKKKILLSVSLLLFLLTLLLLLVRLIYGSHTSLMLDRLNGNSPFQKEIDRKISKMSAITNLEKKRDAVREFIFYFPSVSFIGYGALGSISYVQGDYKDAVKQYTKAISQMQQSYIEEIRTSRCKLFLARGHAYVRLGTFDEAISDYKMAYSGFRGRCERGSLEYIKEIERYKQCRSKKKAECSLTLDDNLISQSLGSYE